METLTHLSRNLLTIFIGLVLLFSLSCSDDPASPKKEDEDPIPQDVVTIGVEGGIIEKDDLTISIPAGAFTENHEISIAEAEDDGAFGENSVSTSYKINGLPYNFSKSLTIKSKYSGQLNGNTFLAIGQMSEDIIENDTSVVYGLYPATDSSGILTSSFPAFSNSNMTKSKKNVDELESLELFVKFLDSYAYKETNNFVIFFPLSAIQYVSKVEEMFEEAYAVVKHGLQKQFDERISLVIVILSQSNPVEVNQVDFKDSQDFQKSYIVREFNISKESLAGQQYNNIQVRAVQELFYYTARSTFSGAHWIVSAIYYWIEDWISDAPDYKYPKNLLELGYLPFYGFEEPDDPLTHESKNWASSGEQGKGMSGVVKYLTQLESFGIGGLGNYYNKSKNYPTSYILDAIGVPVTQWWPDFFKQYINNELFDLPEGYFSKYVYRNWEINTEEDDSKIFTDTYQDLSAQKFKINLNYADLDSTQNLRFKMIGPENNKDLSLILFSIYNNKPQYIETTQLAEYEIINPKSYFSNGTGEFLAVLVNSNVTQDDYLGESDIALTIEVTPKIEPPACTFDPTLYNQCKISLWVLAEKETTNENGTSTETSTLIYNTQVIDGSFNGNTFTGTFESESVKDTITVILNDNLNMVESLTRSGVEENVDWQILWKKGYTAEDIPLNCDSQNKFESNGLDVCNKVSEIIYNYTTPIYSTTLTDFSCEEVSSIIVEFSKK